MDEFLNFPVLIVLVGRYIWNAVHAYAETAEGLKLLDQIETLAGKDLNNDGSVGGEPSQPQPAGASYTDQSGNLVQPTQSGGTYVRKGASS
jgi:hypothetical protein